MIFFTIQELHSSSRNLYGSNKIKACPHTHNKHMSWINRDKLSISHFFLLSVCVHFPPKKIRIRMEWSQSHKVISSSIFIVRKGNEIKSQSMLAYMSTAVHRFIWNIQYKKKCCHQAFPENLFSIRCTREAGLRYKNRTHMYRFSWLKSTLNGCD